MRRDEIVELEPIAPPVVNHVHLIDNHLAGLCPMGPPPLRGVPATEVPFPKRFQRNRNLGTEFTGRCWHDRADLSARFEKVKEVTKVQIRRAKVLVGIKAHDRVEEASSATDSYCFAAPKRLADLIKRNGLTGYA